MAWAQVQNKLQLAMASLPQVVQQQGVKVSKSTKNYLLLVGLVSEDGSMDGMTCGTMPNPASRKCFRECLAWASGRVWQPVFHANLDHPTS